MSWAKKAKPAFNHLQPVSQKASLLLKKIRAHGVAYQCVQNDCQCTLPFRAEAHTQDMLPERSEPVDQPQAGLGHPRK